MTSFERLLKNLSPEDLTNKETERLAEEGRRYLLIQAGGSLRDGDDLSLNFKTSPQVVYGSDISGAAERHAAHVEARAQATSLLLGSAASAFIALTLAGATGGVGSPAAAASLLGTFQRGLELLK